MGRIARFLGKQSRLLGVMFWINGVIQQVKSRHSLEVLNGLIPDLGRFLNTGL